MSAIKDAALQRLRPILMTSASTVLGLIPLAFATGDGCHQRIAMGTAVVGGMVVSTLLTMYIVLSLIHIFPLFCGTEFLSVPLPPVPCFIQC